LDGFKKSEASQLFNISRNTINLWFQHKAETGDVQAKPRQGSGKGQKITDWEKFRALAKAHGDKTQAEMTQLWEAQISERTVSRALHKIGFTRKKRPRGIANGMKPNGRSF
jgi:transposase